MPGVRPKLILAATMNSSGWSLSVLSSSRPPSSTLPPGACLASTRARAFLVLCTSPPLSPSWAFSSASSLPVGGRFRSASIEVAMPLLAAAQTRH